MAHVKAKVDPAALAKGSVHARICPLCEAHCGMLVTIDKPGRNILGVRGDPDDPFSRGYICPKAYSVKELHHDPDVIKRPLLKRDGRFHEIGWDEALDYAAERLKAVQDRHGKNAVGFYIGNPTAHHPGLLLYSPLLLERLGTTQIYCAGSVDHITKVLSSALMYGDCSLMSVPDIDRTDLFVVHGGNPAISNGSLMTAPGMPNRIKAVRERGGKVIVIDPRRSETAELADQYVPIKPGTDAFFLLAIVHHLFATGQVNLRAAGSFSRHLDRVQCVAADFPPARVAPLCGVSEETIVQIANDFACAPSAAWYGRTGTCTQQFGTLSCWLQDVVNIVTGNLDREGGVMFPAGIVPAILYADKFDGQIPPFDRWRSRVSGMPELAGILPTAAMPEEMLEPGEGQIRAFITMAGNPVLSHPNGRKLNRAFEGLDFMLSFDIYMNETTRHADLILPSPSEATHSNFHFFYIPYMVRKIAKWTPALFDVEEGQLHDWDIFLGLAARLDNTSEEAVEDALLSEWVQRFLKESQNGLCSGVAPAEALSMLSCERGPDRLFDVLVRTGPYGDAFGRNPDGLTLARIAERPEGIDLGGMEPQFPGRIATPDGLIDLAPDIILADMERLRAHWRQLEDREDHLLLIGRRHMRSNNSWMHNLNVLVKGKARCTLMMHPQDAEHIGIATGEIATVSSEVNAIDVPVEISDEIMPGVVSIPHGWGHALARTNIDIANDHPGTNANALIDERLYDRPSGNSILNGIPVQVQRSLAEAPPHWPDGVDS